jgi:hypothetical protein
MSYDLRPNGMKKERMGHNSSVFPTGKLQDQIKFNTAEGSRQLSQKAQSIPATMGRYLILDHG